MDDSAGNTQVYFRKSSDGGLSWDQFVVVAQPSEMVDMENPVLIETETNDLLIFIRDSRQGYPQGGWPPYEIFSIRSIDQGNSWCFPTLRLSESLPLSYTNAYEHNAFQDDQNRIHLSWWENSGGSNLFYRNSIDGGYTWNTITRISAFGGDHPMHETLGYNGMSIAERYTDELHGVFTSHWNVGVETGERHGDIYIVDSSDGGMTWTEPKQVSFAGMAREPKIFKINANKMGLIWADERDDKRPENTNWGDEIYFRTINFDKTSGDSPQIYAAGWWQTELSAENGGELQFLLFVLDPQGPQDITRVELLYEGIPTGFMLEPGGGDLGFDPGSGIYGFSYPVDPRSIEKGYYSIQIEVEDSTGNLTRWPYLEIFDANGSAPVSEQPFIPLLANDVSDESPMILVGGYWDTRLTEIDGGILTIISYVLVRDGSWEPPVIELAYAGIPTGIYLSDAGHPGGTGDPVADDNLYTWKTIIPPDVLDGFAGTYPFTIVAISEEGNKSEWPFLWVWD